MRLLRLLCLSLALASPLNAQADEQEATAFVQDLGDRVMKASKDTSLDASARREKIIGLFHDSVDLPWVGRFVLGPYWREASEAQQKRYIPAYERFVLVKYSSYFTRYSGETFKILKTRQPGKEGTYLVSMKIIRPNEPEVLLDYRVREEDGKYAIYDIVAEGVSLISTQREEFGSVISNKGLDYLISMLEKKGAN